MYIMKKKQCKVLVVIKCSLGNIGSETVSEVMIIIYSDWKILYSQAEV